MQLLFIVVGVDIVKLLGYKVGDKIIIFYGLGSVLFNNYDDYFFIILGIVKKIGMFVDKVVYVILQGFEEVYIGFKYLFILMLGCKFVDKVNEYEYEYDE